MPNIDDKTLDKLSVLVTRPAHQAERFCRLIENAGGAAIRFPVIAIVAVGDNPELTQQLTQLSQCDIAIFISANAVQYALPQLADRLPTHLKVVAVGNKTAATLRAHSINVSLLPKQGFNTEALLASPLLHAVQGKQIAIIRGVGGRELLAETLSQRGATITYIEVYKRVLPEHTLTALNDCQNCDIIAVTSQQGLRNLVALCNNEKWLFNTALVSNSQRTAELARELGFRNDIVISPEPDDEAMASVITSWWQSKNKTRQQA